MNNRRLLLLAGALAAGFVLQAAPSATASVPSATPNPLTLRAPAGGEAHAKLIVTNTGSDRTDFEAAVPTGAEQFSVNDRRCVHLAPHDRCQMDVLYHASSAAQDDGVLVIRDAHRTTDRVSVQLNGRRGSGDGSGSGDTKPPNCTLAATRHQKLIFMARRRRNGPLVQQHGPLKVSVLSSEDGTVSAAASGKDSKGKAIAMRVRSAPARAGRGVALKLTLEGTSKSRVLADIRRNLRPKMTVTGTCIDEARNAKQAHAVATFHDAKPGRPFGLPLTADFSAR